MGEFYVLLKRWLFVNLPFSPSHRASSLCIWDLCFVVKFLTRWQCLVGFDRSWVGSGLVSTWVGDNQAIPQWQARQTYKRNISWRKTLANHFCTIVQKMTWAIPWEPKDLRYLFLTVRNMFSAPCIVIAVVKILGKLFSIAYSDLWRKRNWLT